MAEFVVKADGHPSKTIHANTAYASAQKYCETELQDDAKDDEEFDISVFDKGAGKTVGYTTRANVTVHWIVTRKKTEDEGAA